MTLSEKLIVEINNTEITLNEKYIQEIGDKITTEVFSLLSGELQEIRNSVVTFAKSCVGQSGQLYINPEEGMSPGNFDCSGFITYLLSHYGLSQENIRHSNEYFDQYGTFVQNPIPGDLILFSNGRYPSHIGIYIGNNQYIHRSYKSLKVEIADIIQEKIEGNGPYTSNPIGFKRITGKIQGFENSRWNRVS